MTDILMIIFVALTIGFTLSYLISSSSNRKLLDIPNHRSSHTKPTPRAGGAALFAAIALSLAATKIHQDTYINQAQLYWLLAITLVFTVSLLDDLINISILWRLGIQLIAATLVISKLDLSGYSSFYFMGMYAVGILAIVWTTNLYNFMDGINGIAGIEAISFCIGALLLNIYQTNSSEGELLLAIGAASLGFLYWNFPKAKIFMGDSGSAPLGFIFGALIAAKSTQNLHQAVSLAILLGVFVVDASITLTRRLLTGQKFYQPHRSHGYQRAADLLGHAKTSLIVLAINLLWLLPLAFLVNRGSLNAASGLAMAYCPLLLVVIKLNAGKKN